MLPPHRLLTGAPTTESAAQVVRHVRVQQRRPLSGGARGTDLQLHPAVRGPTLRALHRLSQPVQLLLQEQRHLPAGHPDEQQHHVRDVVCVRRRVAGRPVRAASAVHRGLWHVRGRQFHQRVHVREPSR